MRLELNELTKRILGAAFQVHTVLGPGFLELVYEAALLYELQKAGLQVAAQVEIPVVCDNIRLDLTFRADVIVEGRVILELKSVQEVLPIHSKQLLNYLRLSGMKVDLLLNFNTLHLRDQIVRIAN